MYVLIPIMTQNSSDSQFHELVNRITEEQRRGVFDDNLGIIFYIIP